ncbi:uncharacterized protein [Littorina saxatilis]|uniref:ubiquitinyl hydrolase 1 n=1 Tax=Littorina saxatilis TaxID=31220 RepID=A0AAN9G0Z7_9CAEN
MDGTDASGAESPANTCTEDNANNSRGGVGGGEASVTVTHNHFPNTEGVLSVANNAQGAGGESNFTGAEMQTMEGAATIVNEIQGCEGPPDFGLDEGSVHFVGPLANPNMAVQTRYVPKDVKDPMAVHGSCGLHNLGNTCFMNAGIQCLASCSPLLKHLFERFKLTESLRGTLTGAFYLLLCKIWSGKYSVVQPVHFKELLGLYHPQFQDYRQHDCQEFLALLLDTLHEQLNQTDTNSSLTTSSTQLPTPSIDAQGQGHLNNEDLADPPVKGDPLESLESAPADTGSKLLCPESLSSEEEPGGNAGEPSPRSSQGQTSMAPEAGQVRSSLKRASSSPAEAVMAALVSEDSNHSTVSAHSTDSEQSSSFKKLKIESEGSSPGSGLSSVSESCDPDSFAADSHSLQASAASSNVAARGKAGADDNNSADPAAGSMEMSPPTNSSIPQRRCIRLDIPTQGASTSSTTETFVRPLRESVDDADTGKTVHRGVGSKKFNNTESPLYVGGSLETATTSTPSTTLQNDLPPSASSPQDSSQRNPLHFYCKETKTLNTNVLVSSYAQGDVAMDSEKFAKMDNRSQIPVSKEVNLLQEALHSLEEDKVEKALIGKTLGSNSGSSNISNPLIADDKLSSASNLVKSVKTRNHSSILRKPAADPNLLNNSYDYEDEVLVGYSGLVGTSLQKGSEPATEGLECVKADAVTVAAVAEKMELASDMVSLEVEKNVQMQALSKLKATLTKSNIREDISDKASTSESTETEEGEMEGEAESSTSEDEKDDEEEEEPPSRGSLVGDNPASPNPAHCFTAADVATANAAWDCYKARNNSVVVDTFQGQFKSTVVCSECDHVSVTYEPFMYLSLPIPHAMERQICVIFVRPHKSTVRYMLTLHKNDKVQRLRHQLQTLTSTENGDVILAEVLNNHISRLLEDNVMLRYVNDTNRTIHAFQMLPPPEMPPEGTSIADMDQQPPHTLHSIPSPLPSATMSQPLSVNVDNEAGDYSSPDKLNTMLNDGRDSPRSRSPGAGPCLSQSEMSVEEGGRSEVTDGGERPAGFITEDDLDQSQPPAADPMLIGTVLWEWNNRDSFLSDPHPNLSAPPTSPTSDHSGNCLPVDLNLNADYCSEFPQSPSSMDVEMDHIPSTADLASSQMWSTLDDVEEDKGEGGHSRGGASGVIDQWQTCAICLEELMDSQLLTHQACSGVFCHTCLEMSAKHSGELANNCPICLCPVDVSRDFVPLASSSTVKCKVRILAVPVTFRSGSQPQGEGEGIANMLQLICGPRLTYVASQQDAIDLYAQVDRVVPFAVPYTLHFTDGQGLRCSRCEYGVHCVGCAVAKEGEVTLQPGDNLTVHFTEAPFKEELEDKMHVTDDASLEHLRSTDPTSIFDCFDAFTQSEVLDEHNPWYCSCCRRNQCAKKTMTVWRYPDNLIIHLKRFVYEDLSSTKIDNRVVFPHTDLDVTRFLAGPSMSFNIYDLYSIVCHHGGANAGHYTAFSCHPMTSIWYHYNDEAVTQQCPGSAEYDSTYVLLYKRQGAPIEFDLVKDIPFGEEEEEEVCDYHSSSTMAVVPYRSPPPSPTQQSTTAIVTFETEGFSIESGNKDASSSAAQNNQNYDFYN